MVDVGFWGGMVPANSHNATELRAMLDAGALGFKSFFSPSGVRALLRCQLPVPMPRVVCAAECTLCMRAMQLRLRDICAVDWHTIAPETPTPLTLAIA